MYIGLGVLAVGVAYYFYNKSKNSKTSSMDADSEDKSNAQGTNKPRKGGSKAPLVWCNRGAVDGHAWLTQADCDKARKK